MENVVPFKIQILSIIGTLMFMYFIVRQIIRGKLREEYSIIWFACTIIFLIFSFWRKGLEQISATLGVFYPPSLLFLIAIGAIFIFLVHLSIVNSKLQSQIKDLSHEVAFLKADKTKTTLKQS
jgi:hypothetical protein